MSGLGAVFSAATAVGWGGFAILCLYALGLFLLLGAAWYVLLPDSVRADCGSSSGRGWFGMRRRKCCRFPSSAASLLGARAAILHGVSTSLAFASMIVDVTTEMLAQIAYHRARRRDVERPRTANLLGRITHNVFLIGLVLGDLRRRTVRRCAALRPPDDRKARCAYPPRRRRTHCRDQPPRSMRSMRSRARVGLSAALHLAGWIASAIGTWIAFRLIGAHVDIASVIAIESLVCASRSAAAFIPNALGVQEAAYALLAPLFGVGWNPGLPYHY